MSAPPALPRRLLAEGLGTAILVATVVGSGIMAGAVGRRKSGYRAARQHHSHRRHPGGGHCDFGPVSGLHFNPAVTLVFAARDGIWKDVIRIFSSNAPQASAGRCWPI